MVDHSAMPCQGDKQLGHDEGLDRSERPEASASAAAVSNNGLMSIETEHLFTARLRRDADRAVRIKNGPHGTRAIAPVADGGTFEGPRMSGEVRTGASADWATLRPDGSFLIDAHGTPIRNR